jgi:arylsulfatase A-like enzyme
VTVAGWSSWLSRGAVAGIASAAAALAWVEGGGADAHGLVPRGDGPATVGDGGAKAGVDAYQVKLRLVDALGDAVIDTPSLAAARSYFQTHWRKLRGPWPHPGGAAAELVTTIALQTNRTGDARSADLHPGDSRPAEHPAERAPDTHPSEAASAEPAPASPAQEGADADGGTDDGGAKKPWVADVRVWNMNEGSFDQREAIYAPTPATIVFHVPVPEAARLRLSPGVAAPAPGTTIFDVSLVDAAGNEHALEEAHIAAGDDWRWLDVDVDLAPWAGQTVDLRLKTWTLADRRPPPPRPEGAEHAGPAARSREADAGSDRPAPPPVSLALWGNPVIVAKEPARVPYNVLWIVVDAMRPDISASLHDPEEDAEKLAAPHAPLDALLPVVPGLMPSIDRLAARGVHFTHAWSAASWTRPGTLAMLTGERSSEIGIDTSNWVQPADRIAHYYASDPPLLPRLLQKSGVTTAAFVNNFFMTGYANVGLDMGFERVTDHRYRTRDTALITYDAFTWLDAHASDRFFLFLNYNSPHGPYDPTKEMLARIPPPPAGPRDGQVRAYMAEAAKDDTAIGVVLDKLEALGLDRSTIIVVSADHGETLSAAHDASIVMGTDKVPMRFHHAVGNYEETTRIPIVMALPGLVDGGRAIRDRARSIDIAPTILALEGLEPDPRMSGRSLLPLIRGQSDAEPRAVVSEGRYSHALLWDKWRLIVHELPPHPHAAPDGGKAAAPEDELYDLTEDPGERHNVARMQPDVVAEMRARLTAALANVPAADAPKTAAQALRPVVHLRFAGAGAVHHVTGVVTAGDEKHPAVVAVEPSGVAREAFRIAGPKVDFAIATAPDAIVGFDLRIDPPAAPIAWTFYLDDAPWPAGATFAGPFGLPASAAKDGIATADARAEVFAPATAVVDPAHDLGVFVTRDRADKAGEATSEGPAADGEAAKEMQRVLEEWGYAHAPKK